MSGWNHFICLQGKKTKLRNVVDYVNQETWSRKNAEYRIICSVKKMKFLRQK